MCVSEFVCIHVYVYTHACKRSFVCSSFVTVLSDM